jgi:hypothetical protein
LLWHLRRGPSVAADHRSANVRETTQGATTLILGKNETVEDAEVIGRDLEGKYLDLDEVHFAENRASL